MHVITDTAIASAAMATPQIATHISHSLIHTGRGTAESVAVARAHTHLVRDAHATMSRT